MYKPNKVANNVMLDLEDLEYLHDIGKRYNRKNLSQAISMLVKHTIMLEKKLEKIQDAADRIKEPTYKEVRGDQIRKSVRDDQPPDPIEEPKWAFLRKARDQYDRSHNIEAE